MFGSISVLLIWRLHLVFCLLACAYSPPRIMNEYFDLNNKIINHKIIKQ